MCMLCVYISEDQMKTLLVVVKNVTWYEFRPRERDERREMRGRFDGKGLLCFVELSFSFLFFHDAKFQV